MPKSNFSLLATLVPEPDPLDDAKHRIRTITAIMLIVHDWQQGEAEATLASRVLSEVSLTKSQISVLSRIRRSDSEPVILRTVTEAVNIPVTGYFNNKEKSGGEDQS